MDTFKCESKDEVIGDLKNILDPSTHEDSDQVLDDD